MEENGEMNNYVENIGGRENGQNMLEWVRWVGRMAIICGRSIELVEERVNEMSWVR